MTALLVAACGKAEKPHAPPAEKTSHAPMPNQIEVGSTLANRYRIVKKLGDTGNYQVLAAEYVEIEKPVTVMAPKPDAPATAASALHDAAKRQAARGVAGGPNVADVGTTPEGTVYVVLDATDKQVEQRLTGALQRGG